MVADDVDGAIFDPADKLIYAASGDPHLASLIDPATKANVGTVALGGKPEFAAFDPQTRLIYQNLEDAGVVAVVDAARRAVVDRWSLGLGEEWRMPPVEYGDYLHSPTPRRYPVIPACHGRRGRGPYPGKPEMR
jgi:hypothetical protein